MPQKIGGGGRPQPYEKSDGRYIDGVGKSQDLWMPKMVKGGLYDGAGSEGGEIADYENQLKSVLAGTFDKDHDTLIMGQTPKVLQEKAQFPDLPLGIAYKTTVLSMKHEDGNQHYHGLGYENMLQLPILLNNPLAIFEHAKEERKEIIVEAKDFGGRTIFLSVEADTNKLVKNENKRINFIVTVFGANERYIRKRYREGKLLYKRND